MGTTVRALVDFAHIKKGETFSVFTFGGAMREGWEEFANKTCTLSETHDPIIVEPDMYEEVVVTIEDILKHEITHIEKGIQGEYDDFIRHGLNIHDQFDWSKSSEVDGYFESHYIKRWYCTDTWVGYGWITWRGQIVAIFNQKGRKYDCDFKFMDAEIAKTLREFMLQYIEQPEVEDFDVIDPSANLINFFK